MWGYPFAEEVSITVKRLEDGSGLGKPSFSASRIRRTKVISITCRLEARIDPQSDNDISGGSFGIRQVKGTLAGAYELLQGKLFERVEQITGERSGRYPMNVDPEQLSILSGVMGLTKAVSSLSTQSLSLSPPQGGRRNSRLMFIADHQTPARVAQAS